MTGVSFAHASAAIWTPTLLSAVTVTVIPGAGSTVRHAFGFAMTPRDPALPDAVDIALQNARVIGFLLAAAVAVAAAPALRFLLDAVVAATVALNGVVVGTAAGAYAPEALYWLPHLPFEWTAVACATASYIDARRRTAGPTRRVALAAVALVGVGAGVEVYLTPL